jgi:hypothetical protein
MSIKCISNGEIRGWEGGIVINTTTFNNISVISWQLGGEIRTI